MNTRIIGLLLLFGLSNQLAMSEASPQEQAIGGVRQDARYLAAELHRCPAWVKVRADESELRTAITRIYQQFTDWDTKTIREGVERYLNESSQGNEHADAKVFAFLRVVFAVPSGFVGEAKHYGGWGNPVSDGKVNLLWPYEVDDSGKLVLAGQADRYFGSPYDALAEFDELASKYPRRGK
jgi:hypothetical protein